ncbi:MAG TPA: RdgB/HAM1 family non-canonical purine NTP pyrophosphatase [Acidimicrobiales bacterium]|nr:RdgB/HAM1 family non-canonical purine NTP pyrophosphatase [Acidimicrobiales bacterium]
MLSSANPDKAHEIRAIMGDAVELVPRPADVPDVVEDGATLVDNARLKARALCDATGLPALADDTGLEVDALGGAPGVRAARYAGEDATCSDNVAKLLDALDDVADPSRTARFRTVAMVRFPDGGELIADGVVEGRIARKIRGVNGFGYDPIFVPDEGDGRSFAEMYGDEKHAISHRGRALRALAAQLNATDTR